MSPIDLLRSIKRSQPVYRYVNEAASGLLTKSLAIAYFLLVQHAVENHHPISGTQLATLIVAMSAAFGPRMYEKFLEHYRLKQATRDVAAEVRADVTSRFIPNEWADGREAGVL